MKKLMLLLVLMPFLCNAQADQTDVIAQNNSRLEQHNDGNLAFVKAAKTYAQPAVKKENSPKKLKDDQVYVGNVGFKIGGNEIACDSAILYTNDNVLLAFHVKLTNPESFDIAGDMLNYNKGDNTASLTDNVTVTAKNGDVVGTSSSLNFDFSYEIYHITNGSITPLKKN